MTSIDHIYTARERRTLCGDSVPPRNYDVVNKLFEEGRTNIWQEGSVEERVQRLVKSWEMEIVHKVRPQDYKSINGEKFTHSVNGTPGKTLEELLKTRKLQPIPANFFARELSCI